VLPSAVVVDLARGQLPAGLGVDTVIGVDETGGEARVYLLAGDGAEVVVKTQRPPRLRPRTSLAKEAGLLAALARPLAGRIPAVFGYDRVELEDVGLVEFIVMSRVEGRPVAVSAPDARRRAAVLRELAATLRVVHSLDVPAGPEAGLPGDVDGAALRRRVELRLADVIDEFDARPEAWPLAATTPAEVTSRALQALPGLLLSAPVVLHSNPGPSHVFTDTAGAFTGLIDFGDAFVSHPALDLRSWPDPHDRIALRGYYLDSGVEALDRDARVEFDQVWAVAMIWADMAVLAADRPDLATRATADLTRRLGEL
jgi:aminoglycoside phosphotransferase (APT) family kinase protein